MKYMGSKSRIAKHIVPIIQSLIDQNGITTYVEPFVGGANVIDKVKCDRRVGGDRQNYLIALYQNLEKVSELPEMVTHEHYSKVRDCYNAKTSTYPDWYIGAIGFLASYNGRFFDGGYSGVVKTTTGQTRNYYQEAKRNLEAQIPNLRGIEFLQGDYRATCDHFEKALIYCDPPYFGTKQYAAGREFCYAEFWDWCRYMSERNIVLISEHIARDDFTCIWGQPVTRTVDNRQRKSAVERVFCYCETAEELFPGVHIDVDALGVSAEDDNWML